jgi:hypothetical protein
MHGGGVGLSAWPRPGRRRHGASLELAHRGSVEVEAVGGVDQPVEDGVGEGRLVDDGVPSSTGSWLVTRVEPVPLRSSTISMRSRRWPAVILSGPRSSRISTGVTTRHHRFQKW